MARISKEAVVAHAKEQNKKNENKEYQKYLFNQKYNKLKKFEFPKSADIDMNRFFCFPKFDEDFCMSLSAIAIYPVLCLQSNFEKNDWFQISQKNIAKMAGLTVNTVAKGVRDLEGLYFEDEPYLEKQQQTDGPRRYYLYRVNYYRKHDIEKYKGDYIFFYKCLVDSGIWAKLKPRAKALYISMRMSAHFDVELYVELEDLDLDYESVDVNEFYHSEEYRNRKWDVSTASLSELCRKVHIAPINLKAILDQLEKHQFIERIDENKSFFKVYLKPLIEA